MRKVLSLVLAWLFAVTVNAAGGIDHITPDNLKAQNPDGNFSATVYDDHSAVNASMTYGKGARV